MEIKELNLPDVYNYEKYPEQSSPDAKSVGRKLPSHEFRGIFRPADFASVTECDGCVYRSELGAIWATFFKKIIHSFEYEPEAHLFRGWLPDFVCRIRQTDGDAIFTLLTDGRFIPVLLTQETILLAKHI
ncbi:MAG: hypothetical protein PUP93_22090 [Rhizonema sp. NSF051]|nr:hypothetical protein [Rhizonema sp. NSF051]